MKNTFTLNWWPVYLELILDSNEKICVGVCYESSERCFFYKSALRRDFSEALFSDRNIAVGNLAKYACEYSLKILRENRRLEEREVVPGVYLGERRLVEGYELGEIHERVLRKVSFFSYLEFYEEASEPVEPRKGFADFVYEHLLNQKSRLIEFFNQQLRVSGAVKTFDFADKSGGLAANFYVFKKNSKIYKAEVSCLELSMIKPQYEKVSLVAMIDHDYRSKTKRLRSYKEVEGVADHLDISFKIVESPEDAANYLQDHVA